MLSDKPIEGLKWFKWSYARYMSSSLCVSGGKAKSLFPVDMSVLCVFGFGFDLKRFQGELTFGFLKQW